MKEKTSYAKQRVKRMIILGIYQFQDPYYQGVAVGIFLISFHFADADPFVTGLRLVFPVAGGVAVLG